MPASTLKIRRRGRVQISGPAGSEDTARARLEEALYEQLSDACPYLDHSGRAADQASKVASSVPYIVRGRSIVVRASIGFWYRNPPGPWKSWASVEIDGED